MLVSILPFASFSRSIGSAAVHIYLGKQMVVFGYLSKGCLFDAFVTRYLAATLHCWCPVDRIKGAHYFRQRAAKE